MDKPGAPRPVLYTIAAHRGFADALVAGLIPRYREPGFGLARLTVLLPHRRAVKAVTEAFVRQSAGGLLLPRMVVIGDADLGEALGSLFEPFGAEDARPPVPPAIDPGQRLLQLAAFLDLEEPGHSLAARLRRARQIAKTIDRMRDEGHDTAALLNLELGSKELADHWERSLLLFARISMRWESWLEANGMVDLPTRRNQLLDRTSAQWRDLPPETPIVAAGITGATPAVAQLLRVVSALPKGAVILPDLDLALEDAVWEGLGRAGAPVAEGDSPHAQDGPFGRDDAFTHPQYHLKLLLNRMAVQREEVQPWHRSGEGASTPARSRTISNLFLPAGPSARWAALSASDLQMGDVRLMEAATTGEEALAIAILIREALETPEKRVVLVTPDRELAARVIAQLGRWNIAADDTAGTPLSMTAPGAMMLLLAENIASNFAPVPLMALCKHPLVHEGEGRAEWLEQLRYHELALRGPRPGVSLAAIEAHLGEDAAKWWQVASAPLQELSAIAAAPQGDLAAMLAAMVQCASALCGDAAWRAEAGRLLAATMQATIQAATATPSQCAPDELPAILRDIFDEAAMRLPYGSHPRVAIYGLIEARMQRADLVLCGGLHEGSWPPVPVADPVLAPAILRLLGIPAAEFRIGLAAHDLAAALGAPQVVLSYARRDAAGPVNPSRFVLRLRAMLGDALVEERDALALARQIDRLAAQPPHPRPLPMPSAEQRQQILSVSQIDRLRSDPYQFYASKIMQLSPLEALDSEPSSAQIGTAVHLALEEWVKLDGCAPGKLRGRAEIVLDSLSSHPMMRALWRPKILAGLGWLEEETAAMAAAGREILFAEEWGNLEYRGVRFTGKADRVDRLADGSLAVIDYKTGKPPSGTQVEEGFRLQLGVLAWMLQEGGFKAGQGTPQRFEYWSLAKRAHSFGQYGYISEPVQEGQKKGIPRETMISKTVKFLDEALDKWILGEQPFTARLNPDLKSYADYDQLMRLDEWLGRLGSATQSDAP